jgi:hypothetical protein
MKRLILIAGLSFAGVGLLTAQSPDDLNEGAKVEWDVANSTWWLKWWGKAGKSYFIQHSVDLLSWDYLPLLRTGADDVLEQGFDSTGDRCFLRLKISDDPFGTDSDGDGMSDAYEVLNKLDLDIADRSLDLDSDGIMNREDARPSDASIGRLSIVITTPVDNTALP